MIRHWKEIGARETGFLYSRQVEVVETRAVVCPLTAERRENKEFYLSNVRIARREMHKPVQNTFSGDMGNLFKPQIGILKAIGEELTNLAHHVKRMFCIPIEEMREGWHLEEVMRRRAGQVVDGPSSDNPETFYSPEMFLELAPDVTVRETSEQAGEAYESLVVTYKHGLSVGVPVVENNYVIVKGKRSYYCHSLLNVIKARLGAIPKDALHEKIVRRHVHKECLNHGLRPGDRRLAVEFIVRMYWHRSVMEREVYAISEAYDSGVAQSWVKRQFNRFKRHFALGRVDLRTIE
nr:hypothetical protein [Tolivirales sp.]